MEKKSNSLSVIISAYNDDELVCAHVKYCMESSRVPDEIIVVDDCGKLGLRDKLKAIKRNTKIIYARINEDIKWNYTGARNLGMWLSKGDYLSIEDQDHIPCKDYYKNALEELENNPNIVRIKQHKRFVISRDDILNKPTEEWKQISGRPGHDDCAIAKREMFLKLKGYDERFAGAYGWCATDLKRRMHRSGFKNGNAGYMYVQEGQKTRGLSGRNYHYARCDQAIQRPHGILNFTYEYETWN